ASTGIDPQNAENSTILNSGPPENCNPQDLIVLDYFAYTRWQIGDIALYSKKVEGTDEIEEKTILIVSTRSTCDVLWQDGRTERGIPSVELIPMKEVMEGDFMPDDYVLDNTLEEEKQENQVG